MTGVVLEGVVVQPGEQPILDRVSLRVGDGELVAVVGPSGSGKTTILRAIAGVNTVTAGSIFIGGVDVTHLPSRERNVSMVFQDAMLIPFLSRGKRGMATQSSIGAVGGDPTPGPSRRKGARPRAHPGALAPRAVRRSSTTGPARQGDGEGAERVSAR